MIYNKKISAIILAAGNSTRYGKNKIFENINEKLVISYSIETFIKNDYIDEIIIVVKKTEKEKIKKLIEKEKYNKKIKIIIGGSTRKESVYNAIKNTDSKIVIIHDAARPNIKQRYIEDLINEMEYYKGTTIGVKAKDTIKIADDLGIVLNTTKRVNTWLIQTPQCFDRKLLLKLHKENKKNDITDDCILLEKSNYKIKIIEGDYTNIKITTPEDIHIIKTFLNNNL